MQQVLARTGTKTIDISGQVHSGGEFATTGRGYSPLGARALTGDGSRGEAVSHAQAEWGARLEAVQRFRERHGRLPRRHREASEEEVSLYCWRTLQRTLARDGRLGDEEQAQLSNAGLMRQEVSRRGPGRTAPMGESAATLWLKRVSVIDERVAAGGSIPGRKSARTEQEKQMAHWAEDLRERFRAKTLHPRVLAEGKRVPGLFKLSHEEVWAENLGSLEAFVKANGVLPRQAPRAVDEEENRLANWVINQKYRFRHGRMSEAQSTKILAVKGIEWEAGVGRVEDKLGKDVVSDAAAAITLNVLNLKDQQWLEAVREAADWIAVRGVPRQRVMSSAKEKSLATVLAKARQSLSSGSLVGERLVVARNLVELADARL